MAKRVQLPDGSIGEFPDNMDDTAIEGVLRKQFAPAPAPTWADRGREALQGAKSSFDRAALGIKGLLPQSVQDAGDWVDQKMGSGGLNKQTAVQAPDTWAGTAGSIAGDIAMTAAPSGRIAQVASALPRALNFGRGAAALTNAATQIGGNAAMSAAIAPEDRGMAAGAGAIGAGVGMGLQRAMGGLVRPLVTDDAQNMIRRGVNLTPGQAMGGAWNEAEQRMTSLPFAGHFIGSGRQRAYDQAFRGMADDVVRDLPGMLPPQATGTAVALRPNNAVARAGALPRATAAAGPATPQVGREAVGKAAPGNDAMITMRDEIGKVYDNALSVADHVPIDITDTLQTAVRATNARAMNEQSKQQVLNYVANNLLDRVPGASPGAVQNLSAAEVKAMESGLRSEAASYLYSADPDQKKVGHALMEVHGRLRDMLDTALRDTHPEAANSLRQADRAWRAFLPMDRASATMGAQRTGGVPQPRALLSALKALDKSQNDNALRRMMVRGGDEATPYGRLVNNMEQQADVFGDTVADSGTAGRNGMMAALAAGGAMVAGTPLPAVGLATSVAGAAGAYSEVGKRLLTQGVAPETTQRFLAWATQQGIPADMLTAQLPNMLAAYGRQQQ